MFVIPRDLTPVFVHLVEDFLLVKGAAKRAGDGGARQLGDPAEVVEHRRSLPPEPVDEAEPPQIAVENGRLALFAHSGRSYQMKGPR